MVDLEDSTSFHVCACGCGSICRKRYISGHNSRGRTLSEAHKQSLSTALRGRIHSPEARAKLSLAHTGKVLSAEHRAKLGAAKRGKSLSAEHRAKMALSRTGQRRSAEARANMSLAAQRQYANPEARQKTSVALRGKKRSAEVCAQFSETRKRQWQDPDYARAQSQAIIAGSIVKPNRAELSLLTLLAPFGFRYVGDGALMIGRKNPDFVDEHRHIIELYGDYWHAGQDPAPRIAYFAQRGWDCLVIWEHELQDSVVVSQKVQKWLLPVP
jgi:G:T-mismatch repair DNA endonuclease (very short patch repair protein)